MKKFLLYNIIFLFLFLSVFIDTRIQAQDSNREWSIIASYQIPGKASGLAWDGTYLYYGIYGSNGDEVYQVDPANGSYTLLCNGPFDDAYGMSYHSPNLWTIDQPSSPSNPALATEFDFSGNFVSSFALPDHYMSGIAYDAGDFWVCTYYPDPGTVYKVDDAGNVLSQFTPPADQPWDICTEGDNLWIVDYNANMIYKTDQSGNVLESQPAENIKPAGIVFDGNYLWYVDGQLSSPSTLYKVDLGGSGTPTIYLPVQSHNYGTVTIGDSETWNMQVQNTGTADLTITAVNIPSGQPVSTSFTTPYYIAPGGSATIPLSYEPDEFGPLNTNVTINSSDPINPSVSVSLTGNAVYSGPYIFVSPDSYDYGDVRMNAHTGRYISLENRGDELLEVDALNLETENFYVDETVELPLGITPLETEELRIWFTPDGSGQFTDNLEVESNDPAQPEVDIPLEGYGMKTSYPIRETLWQYFIEESYDNSPKAIAPIQDITGDDVSDVIVCSEDNYVRCFNGNSSGTADLMWKTEIYSGSVYQQQGLQTIQDIDDDGYQDVIVGSAWGDRSVNALSGKTGEEIWKFQTNLYGDGGWVYQVDCRYDYNGDGVVDVLAAVGDDSNDNGPRRVFCLNSLTGDQIWQAFLDGPVFSVIGVEDFTGDGQEDVIAGASNYNESEGKTFGINGSDGNIEWTHTANGSSVWALAQLDDINGDGKQDVASGDFAGYYFFFDASNGEVLEQGSVANELLLRFEVMQDVNDDGYSDLLVAHSGDEGIMINGYDASNIWFVSLPDKPWNVARTRDISGDFINDVQIGTLYQNNYSIFLDGVDGTELESVSSSSPIDALNAIPDIVGDESMEMVSGGRNGAIFCYSGGLNSAVGIKANAAKKEALIFDVNPNPFHEQTTLIFNLEERTRLKIDVYSLNGNIVNNLFEGSFPAGKHQLEWDGTDKEGNKLLPGFYMIRASIGNAETTSKVAIYQ
ncbi:MAG: choice-of-anchor D domain-containing protein [Bacteroidales bacterium]|nr:choice-of-anchor D domain-containing protein [Bacteroidales bacterium]MCF8398950.1 choice-of-anchor D domain-containing protein [Bacteroidales bacterium]